MTLDTLLYHPKIVVICYNDTVYFIELDPYCCKFKLFQFFRTIDNSSVNIST